MLQATAVLLTLALAPASHLLVLTDSRAMWVEELPRAEGSLLVATLTDGTLVSLPAARVDWEATEQARVAAVRRREADAERAARKRRPRRAILVTNATVEALGAADPIPVTGRSGSVVQLEMPRVQAPPPRPIIEQDDVGRGPDYWRDRARVVRHNIRIAERGVESAQRAFDRERDTLLHGRTVSNSSGSLEVTQFMRTEQELADHSIRLRLLEDRLDDAKLVLDLARLEERDLRNDARRARADPGWLRLPIAY